MTKFPVFRRTLCAVATLAFSTLGSAAVAEVQDAHPSVSTSLVVPTDRGAVQGAIASGVENFLGIPYAAPPAGRLRWASPQPAAAWSGIRSAQKYGGYCTQPKNFDSPAGAALDEDCLSVNVQRPIGTRPGERLPVYVYIHGGGFVTGSGVKDSQDKIVRMNRIVGVSLNYRLGALGFLALPSLAGRDHQTGDYGLLDQQAALRWVHRNIAAFGGDPKRVTIGGESAGGWSVCTHLVAPGSNGLFSRAIIQSGSCVSHSLAQAEAAGTNFAAKLDCTDRRTMAECLRRKPVSEILAAQARLYVPTSGTAFLPIAPRDAILSGSFSRVPVMIGSMRDEGRSFSHSSVGWNEAQYEYFVGASFGRNAAAVLEAYPFPKNDPDPAAVAYQVGAIRTDDGALGADIVERGIGGCGTGVLTSTLSRYVPVHAYEFSYRMGPGWYSTPGYFWGAGHAAELTYLYPQHDGGKTYSAFTPAELKLSDQLVRYWGAFVIHGKPGQPGEPAWPAYLPGDTLLSFDIDDQTTAISARSFKAQHKCGLWNRLAGTRIIELAQ